MYHMVIDDNPIGPNSLVRRHMKDIDLMTVARQVDLTFAEAKNWVQSAAVETSFRQLVSSYLIHEPTDMPSIDQVLQRWDDQLCSDSPKRYFRAFADEKRSWDGIDHCLRFVLRLMEDSHDDDGHDDCDICRKPHDLSFVASYKVLMYLCKWHMIRVEEENWLADGKADFQCSGLAAWYTKEL